MKPQIITVSRRTDIPAYYADWFRSRCEIGYAAYPNPMSGKPVFINLHAEAVRAFVFWTRNPRPLFRHLDYIDERYCKRHYMHFTINGLPKSIEERNPTVNFAVSSAEFLAKRYGPDYVQWRFDPIVISNLSPQYDVLSSFEYIARHLEGITKRCYFSFVDMYDKTKRNFTKAEKERGLVVDLAYTNMAEESAAQIAFIGAMMEIASRHGIELYACAEERIETITGIKKAHCVDADLIASVAGDGGNGKKGVPGRIGCGCLDSRDIGYYDSCPHGCLYCYANMDPDGALENARRYQGEGFTLDNADLPEELRAEWGIKNPPINNDQIELPFD